MSFLSRVSIRSKSALRASSAKLSAFNSRVVQSRMPYFRSFSSSQQELDSIRYDAITELVTQMNYIEEPGSQVPVFESMIRHLMSNHAAKKKIPKQFVHILLDASTKLLTALPNIIQVQRIINASENQEPKDDLPAWQYGSRLSILGDLHGQYDDLAMLFDTPELGGYPSPYNQYVFNGDLVDRGPMSVETMVTVLFCNLILPNSVHILRGNHETVMCNKQFGFATEVLRKYDADTLNKFHTLFNALPVGAVVDSEYFVVHGGLGRVSGDSTIEELNKVDRFSEPKQESVVSELLWSDPLDNITGHEKNAIRGGEVTTWGPDITNGFLERNKLEAVIRSHEFAEEGITMCHEGRVWTIFSAPNYAHGANLGALIRFQGLNDNLPAIVQYSSAAMKRIADAEKARQK